MQKYSVVTHMCNNTITITHALLLKVATNTYLTFSVVGYTIKKINMWYNDYFFHLKVTSIVLVIFQNLRLLFHNKRKKSLMSGIKCFSLKCCGVNV